MKIVIGLPAYNEEKSIASIITQLKKITDKIIVCNDGSLDQTRQIAEKMDVSVINHSKNMGYGASIKSIFTRFMEIDGDILVTFDADGQHRVNDIEIVTKPIMNNEADIVIGSRFLNNNTEIPKYRKLGIKAITNLTNVGIDNKITDSQSGFRAYTKQVIAQVLPTEIGMGISTEILIKANKNGFRIKEVPIKILYQGDTSTHNPVSHGVSVLLSTMKFVSTEHPLKFYGLPGVCFLAIGLFFVVWTIQYFTEFGVFHPILSLIAIGLTLFGLVFLMTGIMLYSLVLAIREK
jgi:glycosyltransferase involved in cell wall biosynthesis